MNLAVVDGFEIVRVEGPPDERFQAGSVSKAVAALTALRLVRRGCRRARRRRERPAHVLAAPGRRGCGAAPSARPHGRARRAVLPRLRGERAAADARTGARRPAAREHGAGAGRVAAGLGVRVFGRRLCARSAARRGRDRRAVCRRGRRARARAAGDGGQLVLPAARCLAPLSGRGCRGALDDAVRPGAVPRRRPARRRGLRGHDRTAPRAPGRGRVDGAPEPRARAAGPHWPRPVPVGERLVQPPRRGVRLLLGPVRLARGRAAASWR